MADFGVIPCTRCGCDWWRPLYEVSRVCHLCRISESDHNPADSAPPSNPPAETSTPGASNASDVGGAA